MGKGFNFDDDDKFLANFFRRDEDVSMPRSMSRLLMIVGGVAVLAAVIAITWATWPKSGFDGAVEGEKLLVIQADVEPYKVKPEEPGGMEVPNKDSTIFETLKAAQNGEGQVENLLEDNETPVSKDTLVSEPVPVTPSSAPEEKSLMPAPATKSVIATIKEEVAPKKAGAGQAYIQLAAVKSNADAMEKWKSLQGKYDSLKSLPLYIQKADVVGKGIFYRVQAGPLSKDEAASICAKIKSAKGAKDNCLVVK